MSVVRRPLLTATAAGTLLCALWFVPSANATDERSEPAHMSAATAHSTAAGDSDSSESPRHLALADTGGVDTTPYLFGGTAFLMIGAGFVAYSARRNADAL
ncbi:hypothetical protein ACFRR7_02415 [Streptomyces sp. NPDC056909]|uniref:hypothetical protein n=1 Tax=unclassified Streptomyces TaxID=2593676 RepID=UPI003435C5DB|nr:hypothetical protein OG214_14780 [Streptomyces sp. NBC_00872]